MAAQERIAQAGEAARALRNHPAVQRLIQDAEVRNEIRDAVELSRSAYGRLNNGKPPTKALLEDKKLQRELRDAAELLRDAGLALREGPKKRKRRFGLGRFNTQEEVDYVAQRVISEVKRLRELSPLYEMAKEGIDLKQYFAGVQH